MSGFSSGVRHYTTRDSEPSHEDSVDHESPKQRLPGDNSKPKSESIAHSQESELHHHTHDQESHSHSDPASHSHSHSVFSHLHSHVHQPNELLGKGFTTNPAVRITWIGLIVNVVMAASKAAGGIMFHLQALMADAIHSVSDMVADILTLGTVNVAQKVGSYENYPLGYGKVESVGAFLVSGVLLFAGISVGWLSLLQIFEFVLPPQIYEYVLMIQMHSHSHAHLNVESGNQSGHSHTHSDIAEAGNTSISTDAVGPNMNAAWLALALIIVKEVLYRQTMKVAVATNSKVLVANAWHHRIDSLTAAVAFVAVTGGVLFQVLWFDSVGGLLVSFLIINAGWGSFRDAWYELVDRGTTHESPLYDKVKLMVDEELELVTRALDATISLSNLAVLTQGARTNLMLKILAPPNMTLSKYEEFEKDLVARLKRRDKFVGKVLVEIETKQEQ